jgi:hypothetical protein
VPTESLYVCSTDGRESSFVPLPAVERPFGKFPQTRCNLKTDAGLHSSSQPTPTLLRCGYSDSCTPARPEMDRQTSTLYLGYSPASSRQPRIPVPTVTRRWPSIASLKKPTETQSPLPKTVPLKSENKKHRAGAPSHAAGTLPLNRKSPGRVKVPLLKTKFSCELPMYSGIAIRM